MILIDSNVVVASLVDRHPYCLEANALFAPGATPAMMLAAHSHAEAFVTLTRLVAAPAMASTRQPSATASPGCASERIWWP